MRSESYIHAIKEDLAMGLFQDREEEAQMREEIREWEDYRDYCLEKQYERDCEDARFESYWERLIC